ncbi:SLATT domain-containing protein [Paenibacillus sp. FSL E2-0178]|uniref:SLATT domain-containing protein n=1 Tax=Paenibacillus sp. FSL E2-0178 TaxID=2921361 RepID=UPI003159381C
MSENVIKNRLDSLSNKIWITRKARINAEERLEKFDFLTQMLINYYTLVIVGLSIWTLYDESNAKLISVITIIASVLLFGLSIFVNARNFKIRSLTFKSCYIKLDEIYNECELLKDSPDKLSLEDISKIQKKYNKVMNSIENHTPMDYLKVLNNTSEISKSQWWYFNFKRALFIISISIIILLPLMLSYLVTKA